MTRTWTSLSGHAPANKWFRKVPFNVLQLGLFHVVQHATFLQLNFISILTKPLGAPGAFLLLSVLGRQIKMPPEGKL